MKTKTLLLLFAATTMGLAACRKANETDVEAPLSQEITFGVSTDELTKGTAEVNTANLGDLFVSALKSTNYVFQNVSFSKAGDGKWKGGKYWPVTDPGYRFAASNVSLVANSSQPSVQVGNADTDAVVAYLADPTFNAVNTLNLEHIFAQIGTVTMKAPAGYTVTDLKLWLKPITQGTYNLVEKTWTPGSASATDVFILGSAGSGVDLTEGGSKTSDDNDLWLVPGTYTLNASYTISKDAYSKSKTATATVSLSQGYNNNIGLNGEAANIPAPDDISEISFTVTVTPWSNKNVTASFTEKNS